MGLAASRLTAYVEPASVLDAFGEVVLREVVHLLLPWLSDGEPLEGIVPDALFEPGRLHAEDAPANRHAAAFGIARMDGVGVAVDVYETNVAPVLALRAVVAVHLVQMPDLGVVPLDLALFGVSQGDKTLVWRHGCRDLDLLRQQFRQRRAFAALRQNFPDRLHRVHLPSCRPGPVLSTASCS